MKLYHGSYAAVPKPDIAFSRSDVDFGRGFYTTAIPEQAQRWSDRFKKDGRSAVVSEYGLNEEALNEFSVKRFEAYDEEWLDFVMTCRRELDKSSYDVVEGGVANDRVFNTIELYFAELIGKEEALGRLRFEKPNHQMCFRTQEAIDRCLTFEGSVVL